MALAQYSENTTGNSIIDVESVAFLKQMAALVPGIIYVFNHKTMSNEYANRSIAEMLGYGPEEIKAMGDELLPTIIHPSDFDRLAEFIGSLQNLGAGEQASWEYRAVRRDGGDVWLRSVETVFSRAADGAVLRTIGIATDITAQKTAELELRHLNAELEARVLDRTEDLAALNDVLEQRVEERTKALVNAKTEIENLNYVATHDLKVPIDNISSLVHMLEDARKLLPSEHAETLDWMHSASEQATRKLDALICVAQANSTPQGPFVHVNLESVIERVLAGLHFQLDNARAAVKTILEHPTVYFLPQQVESILQAILSNALSYRAPDRKLRLTIKSGRVGNAVALSVEDNGSGFNRETDLEKVFGLFQRAHVTPDGAGVSLYTIRCIMDRIGGSIDVASQLGKGSLFSLTFPEPDTNPET